jgi:hypothetical protein
VILMNEVNPSLEEYLEHHGVKGMKWGVRRQQRRERNAQIKTARKNVRAKEDEIIALDRKARKSKSASERARLDKISTKKASDLFNSPDHTTAARLTSGEKWTKAILIGTVITAGGAAGAVRSL